MRNIWIVAQHEFWINIRKPAFLFAVFGMPVIMAVLFGLVFYATLSSEIDGIDPDNATIGYVDRASILEASVTPPQNFVAYDNADAARAALDADEIDVYFIIPPVYVATGNLSLFSYSTASFELEQVIEDFMTENLAAKVESDLPAERLGDPVNFDIYLENSQRELTQAGLVGLFIVPLLFSIVIMLGLQLTSTYLMSSVVDEKSNHIMEILISSIRPLDLLTGKILGLSALGLVQIGVWIVFGGVILNLTNDNPFLSSVSIPLDFLLLSLVYFLLTYLLFSSLLAGIGAVVGGEQESRTYAGLVGIVVAIPLFFFAVFLTNPDAPIITVLTFIPFTSAMTVILKTPFAPTPTWQIVVSLVILSASTLFTMWASAKLFRWGLLLYGKKIGIGTVLQVLRGTPDVGMIPTADTAQDQGGQA